jgi:hypothetical protein
MTTSAGGYAALAIGVFQVLANVALLLRGFSRLPAELVAEGATARIAHLLRTAWVYGMLGNVCVSLVLIFLYAPLRSGDPLATRIASVIGVYYVVLGVATYAFAPVRTPGMLAFSVLGLVLLGTLWLGR